MHHHQIEKGNGTPQRKSDIITDLLRSTNARSWNPSPQSSVIWVPSTLPVGSCAGEEHREGLGESRRNTGGQAGRWGGVGECARVCPTGGQMEFAQGSVHRGRSCDCDSLLWGKSCVPDRKTEGEIEDILLTFEKVSKGKLGLTNLVMFSILGLSRPPSRLSPPCAPTKIVREGKQMWCVLRGVFFPLVVCLHFLSSLSFFFSPRPVCTIETLRV